MRDFNFTSLTLWRTFISSIIILFILPSRLCSQQTSATFDSTWADALQAAIDQAAEENDVQGVSVALKVPGQGTFIGVAGESFEGVPITPDMQFGIGSNSKLFVSVLLLILQEQGILSLDEPLSAFLPEYQYVNPSITVRQLLNHQSGIFDFEQEIDNTMNTFVFGPDSFYTPENVLALIGPPHFEPGEAYFYSNTNYLLAAMVVEAATGKSFVENLHQYILDPLDLDSTFVAAYETPNGNVAHSWHFGTDIGNVPTKAPHSMYLGSGSIFSTASEMIQWYDQLFGGNILSQASMDELIQYEPSSSYGLGIETTFFPVYADEYVWAHNGWVPGYTSQMGYDVRLKSPICIMANDEDEYSILIPVLTEFYFNYPRKTDDAGIASILSPTTTGCNEWITPEVILQNFGTNNLTSALIHYGIEGEPEFTFSWTGNLINEESISVELHPVHAAPGRYAFFAYTSHPNGSPEGYENNDRKHSNFIVSDAPLTLLNEGFEGAEFPPTGWLNGLERPLNWGRSSLSLLNGNGCAAKSNYPDGTYRSYDLELPVLDVSGLSNPVMSFYYAYANYPGYFDSLAVLISSDCGDTYHNLFYKGGYDLFTAFETYYRFYPKDDEWKQVNLDLSAYDGEVWIKIRDITGWSNNVFVDDVLVGEGCLIPVNLSVSDATSTSALLHWEYGSIATQFDIYYRASESQAWAQWEHVTVDGNNTSVSIVGLDPNTSYDWYITADCSLGTSPESGISQFITPEVVSTNDELKNAGFVVFPNPATNSTQVQLDIKHTGDWRIQITDMTGFIKEVFFSETINGMVSRNIDLDTYRPGIYFIEVKTGQATLVRKLVVQ